MFCDCHCVTVSCAVVVVAKYLAYQQVLGCYYCGPAPPQPSNQLHLPAWGRGGGGNHPTNIAWLNVVFSDLSMKACSSLWYMRCTVHIDLHNTGILFDRIACPPPLLLPLSHLATLSEICMYGVQWHKCTQCIEIEKFHCAASEKWSRGLVSYGK